MRNLALNLGRNTKCEFNSPETGTEEKSRPLHVPRGQVSMQRAGEFTTGSCTLSETPAKEEARAGGESRNTTLFPQTEAQTQPKPRKLP